MPPGSPLPPLRGLYAVTPDAVPLETVAAVLQGGCRWLQYRDKGAAPAQKLERAHALAGLCRQHGAALLINDDVELALAVGAAGVHLGRDDGDIAAARARLGAGAIIGASCYNEWERAAAAAAAGADYLAFGALFPSPTKPAAARAPLELPGRARAAFGLPVCAIGGITLATAPTLLAAQVDLLAVITDLFAAADPCGRAAAFQSLFQESAS